MVVRVLSSKNSLSWPSSSSALKAFAEVGADVLFIDALESEEEMLAFTGLGGAAARVPKVRQMWAGR